MSQFKDEKLESILPRGSNSLGRRKSSKIYNKPIDLSVYQTIIDIVGINSLTWKIYLITSLFLLSDGGEMIVLSLMLGKVSESWGLSPSMKGSLGSSVFIGIFIGALFCARFSDIKGRRPVFIIGSLLVTIFSLVSAFCDSYFTFFIARGLCGVGVGLSIPSSSALSLEVTPTKYRHFVIVVLMFTFPFGEIFVILFGYIVLPMAMGWRYLLAFATLPCLICFLVSLIIHESPKFLLTTRRFEEGFESLEKLIQASGKEFILTDEIKEKLKEEFIIYTKLLEDDTEEVEETPVGFIQSIKNALTLTTHQTNEEEYSEENLRKKLEEFLQKDRKEKQIKKDSLVKQLSNDDFSLKKNNKSIGSSDFNMFQNIYSTGVEKIENESDQINEKFSKDNRNSINSLTEENITPSFNYKELFTKKYKFLSIMIWILFAMCSITFYGMIYILPQILEKIESNNLHKLDKLMNYTQNNSTNITYTQNNSTNITFIQNNSTNITYIQNNSTNIIFSNQTIIHDHEDTGNMSYNNFIQLMISASMQIPSTILACYMASFGRIKSMAFGFFFSFIFCLIALTSESWFFVGIAWAKFFICMPDMIQMLYVCEAYPTKIRALGIGVANSFYRTGGVITPFVNQLLFEYHHLAPYALFTVGSLVGFIATVCLPFESVGKNIR